MEFLSIETLKEQFGNENLDCLLESLNDLRKQAITLIDAEKYDALVSAVANQDYDATMTAIQAIDKEHNTVLVHLQDLDPAASGIDDTTEIDNLIELALVHEIILDHTYSAVESTTLIATSSFVDFIRECELDAGNIASHLIEYVDWKNYAEQGTIDYEEVEISAPNTLGLDNETFYCRK